MKGKPHSLEGNLVMRLGGRDRFVTTEEDFNTTGYKRYTCEVSGPGGYLLLNTDKWMAAMEDVGLKYSGHDPHTALDQRYSFTGRLSGDPSTIWVGVSQDTRTAMISMKERGTDPRTEKENTGFANIVLDGLVRFVEDSSNYKDRSAE